MIQQKIDSIPLDRYLYNWNSVTKEEWVEFLELILLEVEYTRRKFNYLNELYKGTFYPFMTTIVREYMGTDAYTDEEWIIIDKAIRDSLYGKDPITASVRLSYKPLELDVHDADVIKKVIKDSIGPVTYNLRRYRYERAKTKKLLEIYTNKFKQFEGIDRCDYDRERFLRMEELENGNHFQKMATAFLCEEYMGPYKHKDAPSVLLQFEPFKYGFCAPFSFQYNPAVYDHREDFKLTPMKNDSKYYPQVLGSCMPDRKMAHELGGKFHDQFKIKGMDMLIMNDLYFQLCCGQKSVGVSYYYAREMDTPEEMRRLHENFKRLAYVPDQRRLELRKKFMYDLMHWMLKYPMGIKTAKFLQLMGYDIENLDECIETRIGTMIIDSIIVEIEAENRYSITYNTLEGEGKHRTGNRMYVGTEHYKPVILDSLLIFTKFRGRIFTTMALEARSRYKIRELTTGGLTDKEKTNLDECMRICVDIRDRMVFNFVDEAFRYEMRDRLLGKLSPERLKDLGMEPIKYDEYCINNGLIKVEPGSDEVEKVELVRTDKLLKDNNMYQQQTPNQHYGSGMAMDIPKAQMMQERAKVVKQQVTPTRARSVAPTAVPRYSIPSIDHLPTGPNSLSMGPNSRPLTLDNNLVINLAAQSADTIQVVDNTHPGQGEFVGIRFDGKVVTMISIYNNSVTGPEGGVTRGSGVYVLSYYGGDVEVDAKKFNLPDQDTYVAITGTSSPFSVIFGSQAAFEAYFEKFTGYKYDLDTHNRIVNNEPEMVECIKNMSIALAGPQMFGPSTAGMMPRVRIFSKVNKVYYVCINGQVYEHFTENPDNYKMQGFNGKDARRSMFNNILHNQGINETVLEGNDIFIKSVVFGSGISETNFNYSEPEVVKVPHRTRGDSVGNLLFGESMDLWESTGGSIYFLIKEDAIKFSKEYGSDKNKILKGIYELNNSKDVKTKTSDGIVKGVTAVAVIAGVMIISHFTGIGPDNIGDILKNKPPVAPTVAAMSLFTSNFKDPFGIPMGQKGTNMTSVVNSITLNTGSVVETVSSIASMVVNGVITAGKFVWNSAIKPILEFGGKVARKVFDVVSGGFSKGATVSTMHTSGLFGGGGIIKPIIDTVTGMFTAVASNPISMLIAAGVGIPIVAGLFGNKGETDDIENEEESGSPILNVVMKVGNTVGGVIDKGVDIVCNFVGSINGGLGNTVRGVADFVVGGAKKIIGGAVRGILGFFGL